MVATDVAPNRLEAARAAITSFVDHVPRSVKVGTRRVRGRPGRHDPANDQQAVLEGGHRDADAGLRDGDRRCAGTGGRPRQVLDGSDGDGEADGRGPEGAVVLLSDGTQTHGVLAPNEGAHLAEQAGIPVYTIALGTLSGTVTINRFGAEAVVPVPPDRATLASIAESTGGSTFEVTDAARLSSVYDRLGHIVARTTKPREVTAAFVGVAAALLAAAIGLAALSAPRLP